MAEVRLQEVCVHDVTVDFLQAQDVRWMGDGQLVQQPLPAVLEAELPRRVDKRAALEGAALADLLLQVVLCQQVVGSQHKGIRVHFRRRHCLLHLPLTVSAGVGGVGRGDASLACDVQSAPRRIIQVGARSEQW